MYKIAVLISGGGSNLQSIINGIDKGILPCEISLVISDRPAAGLDRARKHGISTVLLNRKNYGDDLNEEISKHIPNDTNLILLAGYLSILSRKFIQNWEGKIINIHPSLLPDFGGKGMYGRFVHESVIEAKEKTSGVTIHFVNEEYDKGEFILQKSLNIDEYCTVDQLEDDIKKLESLSIVEAFQKLI